MVLKKKKKKFRDGQNEKQWESHNYRCNAVCLLTLELVSVSIRRLLYVAPRASGITG